MTSDVVSSHNINVESSSLLCPNSTLTSSTCRLLVPNQPPRSKAAIFSPFGSNFRGFRNCCSCHVYTCLVGNCCSEQVYFSRNQIVYIYRILVAH
ncbi:hypothetical protein QYF36_013927 [Acer negundo]|nr:hypothetical protein QYF36_013927 [Acer negundo]